MSKNHYRLLLAGIFLCIAAFTAFWWNEWHKSSATTDQHPYHIEVVFKSYNRPPAFWSNVGDGIMAAEKEFGVTCHITAPYTEGDIDTQINLMEQAIAARPNAIILAAADYERLVPVCEKAVAAGILLLTVDSDVNTSARQSFVGTDNVELGRKLGELLAEQTQNKAAFGVISHVEGTATATATDRLAGLLEATPDGDARMEGFAYCNGSEELAKAQTMELLKDHPDIRCMVGLNESSALGIANALKELELSGQISLVVCDSSEKQIQFLENGTIQACVVQNPFSMGYLSVANAVKLLNRQNVEPITYTDSVIVRKKNLNTAEFQQLIIPFTP
ncbi:MAG: substrate-binding domain-containing protein [Gemmiger sp.]|nr:substrate-binding domain-containing protein [Gemmiger sp.]